MRDSGIEIVGRIPWGMHICLFYKTKKDFLNILVPYFKAGLENNEFCMLVTSESLPEKQAKEALKKEIKNFNSYLKKVQIEIVPNA